MSHLIGSRKNTPDLSNNGLRPPTQRNTSGGNGHHLRASADLGAFGGSGATSPHAPRGIRPLSEVFLNPPSAGTSISHPDDAVDQAAQQWIADIDQYETTLEEMAAATLDQDFKDELSAIEQWFRVLSEPERTASLYALLQQTTQVQIRFFIQVLQQMAKNLPITSVMSPANFGEKDAMSSRLNDAMSRLNVDGNRTASLGFSKPPLSPGIKRNSVLDPNTLNSMFPDAVAAIAKQKADFKEHTGNMASSSNRNGAVGDRSSSYVPPTISTNQESLQRSESNAQLPPSPWNTRSPNEAFAPIARPKSSTGQHAQMGQFAQPLPSASLLSPRTRLPSDGLHKASIDSSSTGLSTGIPALSPYNSTGNWASMVSTPMTSTFGPQSGQVDMVTNATAMKLAALSTVNNRIQLDDAKKYRRARSSGGPSPSSATSAPNGGFANTNINLTNELGQVLSPQQTAFLHAQQLAHLQARNRGSRPNSPGMPPTPGSAGYGASLPMSASTPNGFLSAYDQTMLANGMAGMNMNHHLGLDDFDGDAARGRSPRGRRGPLKAPDDPTDLALLVDIPSWLRTLRLHKYTDVLKDMAWQKIVVLDDSGLEKVGVNALGARRKLLKVFEQVRETQGPAYPEILAGASAGASASGSASAPAATPAVATGPLPPTDTAQATQGAQQAEASAVAAGA